MLSDFDPAYTQVSSRRPRCCQTPARNRPGSEPVDTDAVRAVNRPGLPLSSHRGNLAWSCRSSTPVVPLEASWLVTVRPPCTSTG